MRHLVMVVTAAPGCNILQASHIGEVLAALSGRLRGGPRWLGEGAAFEIGIQAGDWAEALRLRAAAEERLVGIPVDVNLIVVGAAARRKGLLVADMDSTILEVEMIDELAEAIGIRAEIAPITLGAMRGEIDFATALEARVAMFAGQPEALLHEIAATCARPNPGAVELVEAMRRCGAVTALVSSGFTAFTCPVARRLGFTAHFGNVLEVAEGRITGRVRRPIRGAPHKAAVLRWLARKLCVLPEDTVAVGDGANDLEMLEAAGLGVAFRAKPIVRDAMRKRPNGAVIEHGDLTALLHLQGVTQATSC